MKPRGGLSYERKKALAGYGFILPWMVGFLLFFLIPIVQSFLFSLSELRMGKDGLVKTFVGLKNYVYDLTVDAKFIPYMTTLVTNVLIELPIIVIFSLFIAILLKKKFTGRTLMRAIFFLPVIITSGVVIVYLKEEVFGQSMNATQNVYMFRSIGFTELLTQMGLPYAIVSSISTLIDRIFALTWKSGVQILMFLAGLQTIPPMYYEASSIEGASGWDAFWKITLPLVSPVVLLNVVFTIIDSFSAYDNEVMRYIHSTAFGDLSFGLSASQSWLFFVVVSIVLSVAYALLGRRIFYVVD
jgi:ABC-type sugar transport system permease subunit